MPAETQSAQAQAAKAQIDAAFREQERLRATLSPEELAADHAQKVEALLRTCQQIGEEAKRNGLTEEILAAILAEE